jgi:hypothetical protein
MKLALIGAGNLAWNLAAVLKDSPYEIVQVFSRHIDSAFKISRDFPAIEAAFAPSQLRQDLDLVIVASSDHGIGEIAEAYCSYKADHTVVAHTAGSIPLDVLAPFGPNTGVFYPLQTFTKGHKADFHEIPVFLEGDEKAAVMFTPFGPSFDASCQHSGFGAAAASAFGGSICQQLCQFHVARSRRHTQGNRPTRTCAFMNH